MKKLVPWLKANLISVIVVVLALIAVPVALFFSQRWAASVRSGVEAEVKQSISQLDQLDVVYNIDSYLSGQEAVSVKAPPNEATTKAVSELLRQVVSGVEAVRERAIAFNSEGKTLLIKGDRPEDNLFPKNDNESARLTLLDRFIKRYPVAHEELLSAHRAGRPAAPETIRAVLMDLRTKEISRRTTGRGENDLTPQDREELNKLLSTTRLELYRRDAGNISFYTLPGVFTSVMPWDAVQGVMPIETAWDWQFNYWVNQDIIRALAQANTDDAGVWQPVYRGAVKLVESITISTPAAPTASADGGGGGGAGGGPTDGAAEVARNYSMSHTGRAASPVAPNPLYDIRYVDITMIVSSSRLPQIIDAFPRINFMSVIDLDIEEVSALQYLSGGYDLGADHLVRATMRVETIWLRTWTKTWMPPSVRKALGIPDDPVPQPADSASQGSAPQEASS